MKILVALDGSDSAYNAMRSACRIASKTGSYIVTFYVNKAAEYSPEETGWTSVKERIARELETFGQEVIHEAYKIGREFDVPVDGIVSDGIPTTEIVKYVDAHGIVKLIALGHSSKGRGAREFVESTTESVVEHARVPVFVTGSDIEIKSILLAVDDPEMARAAAAFGGNLAKSLGAELRIISIRPDAEAVISDYSRIAEVRNIERHIEAFERDVAAIAENTLSSVRGVLSSLGINAPAIIKKGLVTDEIISEAKNHDLLVIGIRKSLSHKKLGRTVRGLLDSRAISTIFVQ